MKKYRRLLLVLAILVMGMVSGWLYLDYRVHALPGWYHRLEMDAESRRLHAQAVEVLLGKRLSAANTANEAQRKADADGLTGVETSVTVPPIELTEEGITAWTSKWDSTFNLKSRLGKEFDDPVIILTEGHIILAANYKEWNTLLSIHLVPRLESGKLIVHIESIMAGTLPLPKWGWSRFTDKLTPSMQRKLPALQRAADIDVHNRANSPAVEAGMLQLMLHTLRDEPAEPVLFLPETGRGVAMQITGISVVSKKLTIQIAPMSADQREAYLVQLRGSEQSSISLGK